MKNKSNYNCIDLVKFLCSFLVIAIHIVPLTSVHWILNFAVVNYVARLAVPFFFTVTGFLVFRKIDIKNIDYSVIYRHILKLLKLYIIWSLIYFPFALKDSLGASFSPKDIVYALIFWFRNFLFSGSYYHLWYLNGIIVALSMICIALKLKLKPHTILLTGLILYIIGLLGDSYYGLTKPLLMHPQIGFIFRIYKIIFSTTRNGIFDGFVFVSLGMVIAVVPRKMSLLKSILGFIISLLFLGVEVLVLFKFNLMLDSNMYIMLLPSVYFMLYAVLGINLKNNTVYKELRILSSLIYFIHILIYTVFVEPLEMSGYINHSLILYFLTAIITLLVSWVLRILSKRKISILKNLYM